MISPSCSKKLQDGRSRERVESGKLKNLTQQLSLRPAINYFLFAIRLQVFAFVFLFGISLLFPHSVFSKASSQSGPEVLPLEYGSKTKNVILFIGDGMGISQISAARIRKHGTKGWLQMQRMPVVGIVRTHAQNALITDSAAAATALATGHKTMNGVVGMNPEGKVLSNFLDSAKAKGFVTGVVATSRITHATPACFLAHSMSRQWDAIIAQQVPQSGVDLILGGGRGWFMPQHVSGSLRADDLDLLAEAEQRGYTVLSTRDELEAQDSIPVLGLFALNHLKTWAPEPSLDEMTAKAISLLNQNKKGFVLIIEGSQIDWGGHANNPEVVIRQTLLLDNAIGRALKFALEDKKTLVLVTADHETGGFSVNNGGTDGQNLVFGWTTKNHTGQPVPLFAFGPGASDFLGQYDNTEVAVRIANRLGLAPIPTP